MLIHRLHRVLNRFTRSVEVGNQSTVLIKSDSSAVATASSTDSQLNMVDRQTDRMRHGQQLRHYTCSRQWHNSYRASSMVSSSGRRRGTTQVSKDPHRAVRVPTECIRHSWPYIFNLLLLLPDRNAATEAPRCRRTSTKCEQAQP